MILIPDKRIVVPRRQLKRQRGFLLNPFRFASSAFPISGLVEYWRFDEGTGTSTTGAIASTAGTLTSSALWGGAKLGASALHADGTNYVNLPTANNLLGLGNDWTVAAWIYGVSAVDILDLGYQSSSFDVNNLGLRWIINGSGFPLFRVQTLLAAGGFGGSNRGDWQTGLTLKSAEWNLVVMSRSQAGAGCRVYNTDGMSEELLVEALNSIESSSWSSRANRIHAYSTSAADTVAAVSASGNGIDELAVWSRVLSGSEADAIWASGSGLALPT